MSLASERSLGKERLKARSNAFCASVGLAAKCWGWVDKEEPAAGVGALGSIAVVGLTLVRAESVVGVMMAAAEVEAAEVVLLTMAARKAAVLGEGGGKDMPPLSGVRPVLKLERSGVKPVRNELGSKWAL